MADVVMAKRCSGRRRRQRSIGCRHAAAQWKAAIGDDGHNYIGHNYIGHNLMGHAYTARSYIGHTYVGRNLWAIGADGRSHTVIVVWAACNSGVGCL